MHPRQSQRPELRLYVLDTGVIECADHAMFSPSMDAVHASNVFSAADGAGVTGARAG